MATWRCPACSTINDTATHECEVCGLDYMREAVLSIYYGLPALERAAAKVRARAMPAQNSSSLGKNKPKPRRNVPATLHIATDPIADVEKAMKEVRESVGNGRDPISVPPSYKGRGA
jgi:hypothetical protein